MDYAFLLCYRTVTCVCCLLKALFSGLRSHCTNVDWENSELAFSCCFCIWWMCRLWKSSLPFQWILKSHLFIMMCLSFQPFCFSRCQYNQNRIVPVSSVSACQHTAISRTCLFIRWSWCCGPGLLFFLTSVSTTTKKYHQKFYSWEILTAWLQQPHFWPQIYLTSI